MDHHIVDNEKAGLLPHADGDIRESHSSRCNGHVKKRRGLPFYISLLILTWWCAFRIPALLAWMGKGAINPTIPPPPDDSFTLELLDFDDIVPSEKLEWHSCFLEPFKCARLTVPMDYHRPLNESGDNPKVHIALLLAPGKHSGSKKASTSPLLINPGGPGGSGTMFAMQAGVQLQTIVGQDQDILGFDPRGIGATTPKADCFSYPYEDSTSSGPGEREDVARGNFHRTTWTLQGREIGTVNASTGSLRKVDARARSIAKLCGEKDAFEGKDSIFKYAHTPSVARDMISIIDAWDEWTESLAEGTPSCKDAKNEDPDSKPEDGSSLDTKGKLVYWGFSYGTLLGATFASMFPDRVGRLVLDGVVDADYWVTPIWEGSLRDADAISNSFSKYCHEGKAKCALYRPGDTVEDVDNRFNSALEELEANPIVAIQPITRQPVNIHYSDFRMILFAFLYFPIVGWPVIAAVIDILSRGHGELMGPLVPLPDLKPTCAPPLPSWAYPDDAQITVMCSDKRYPLNETLPGMEKILERMTKESSWADVLMTILIGCEAWPVKAVDPPMRWDDHPAHNPKPITTSHPIFFISNTHDPITPLHSGLKMVKKFANAGFLEQKSQGHCSIFSAVSRCTVEKVRTYFQTGEVPPPPADGEWETCESDEWPFHPYDGQEFAASDSNGVCAAEIARMDASKMIQMTAATEMNHWGRPSFKDTGLDIVGGWTEILASYGKEK